MEEATSQGSEEEESKVAGRPVQPCAVCTHMMGSTETQNQNTLKPVVFTLQEKKEEEKASTDEFGACAEEIGCPVA